MKIHARALALCAAMAAALPAPVAAQSMPPFSVYGEADDETNQACKVSHAASIAFVDRELRKFNITTSPHTSETLSRNFILTYITLTSLQIKNNGVPNGSCATSVMMQIYSNTNFTNPVNKASHFGKVIYCDRNSLLVWSTSGAQAAVNKDLATFVTECVKEYNESRN